MAVCGSEVERTSAAVAFPGLAGRTLRAVIRAPGTRAGPSARLGLPREVHVVARRIREEADVTHTDLVGFGLVPAACDLPGTHSDAVPGPTTCHRSPGRYATCLRRVATRVIATTPSVRPRRRGRHGFRTRASPAVPPPATESVGRNDRRNDADRTESPAVLDVRRRLGPESDTGVVVAAGGLRALYAEHEPSEFDPDSLVHRRGSTPTAAAPDTRTVERAHGAVDGRDVPLDDEATARRRLAVADQVSQFREVVPVLTPPSVERTPERYDPAAGTRPPEQK